MRHPETAQRLMKERIVKLDDERVIAAPQQKNEVIERMKAQGGKSSH